MTNAVKLGYANVTQAAASIVKTGPAGLYGIVCTVSTAGTVTIYDSVDTSGTVLYSGSIAVGAVVHFGGNGIAAKNGLYVSCGGTCTVNILYT